MTKTITETDWKILQGAKRYLRSDRDSRNEFLKYLNKRYREEKVEWKQKILKKMMYDIVHVWDSKT